MINISLLQNGGALPMEITTDSKPFSESGCNTTLIQLTETKGQWNELRDLSLIATK
jgi:hypothetical protein